MEKKELKNTLVYTSISLAILAIVLGGTYIVQLNKLSNDIKTLQKTVRDLADEREVDVPSAVDSELAEEGITLRGMASVGENGELEAGNYKITVVEADDFFANLYIYNSDNDLLDTLWFSGSSKVDEIPSYVLREGYELEISNVSLRFTKVN